MRDRVILITCFGPDTQEEAGLITSLLPSTVQDALVLLFRKLPHCFLR